MSKEKTVSLNISERVESIKILNQYKGNLDTLTIVMDDLKKLRISDEEWEKAGRENQELKDENGNDVVQFRWDNDKGGETEIILDSEVVKYLKAKIDEKNNAGEFTLADVFVRSLRDKLN